MRPTSSASLSSEISLVEACRLGCGGELEQVLELAPPPPANAFLLDRQASLAQPRYPLELMLCRGCGHLQLHHELDRELLFKDYLYASGVSASFREHFRRYAESVIAGLGLQPGELVVDVGSNDGTLLRCFKDAGMQVLGVEP